MNAEIVSNAYKHPRRNCFTKATGFCFFIFYGSFSNKIRVPFRRSGFFLTKLVPTLFSTLEMSIFGPPPIPYLMKRVLLAWTFLFPFVGMNIIYALEILLLLTELSYLSRRIYGMPFYNTKMFIKSPLKPTF